MTTSGWGERYSDALMNTFGPPKTTLVSGSGARVTDADGKEYVDFLGGIAVNTLGHGHPALVRAVSEQAARLVHVSNFFATPPQVELAERLLGLLGCEGRVFFANSGTEANEAAFKLTRRTGRTRIVAAAGGFHGRTMGALALTSKEAYRTPFAPLPGDVTFVEYGDAAALEAAVDDSVAAVLLEPVQGEAGVVVPPTDYLVRAQQVARDAGALLWLDEVQSGIGRTGTWFAHQNPALVDGTVVPDVITLAKGLAGGVPIGACIATGGSGKLFDPGNHGTTFGGNPLATAAALAVLDTVESEGLLERSRTAGARLGELLAADPRVTEVRGAGLMVGIDLSEPYAAETVAAGQDAGFVLNAPSPTRMRFVPPLVVTDADLDALAAAWSGILDTAYAAGGAA
ncbi:acetylornithine/N-succinyldiaminopimelate aminotransferase [Nocardioides zeae]|uniref:Acetylornithine/N-succinyldiaminopimelate aminotransferase n=1 Tax=Nocardioides zeae TaxID=1457234 RepID=A0ACC6INC5_9ACTN|nr:acetylornithine transaminase [Nocardioides zeae]MDR6176063.1 acetylornithine/N-succinyldiaminopimelate aminotransferase [Nocardioides zeae]MDR6212113.1 acetylornithine/N-succinyldiaminopimelate aminotransferase [Nocardioides zeae]